MHKTPPNAARQRELLDQAAIDLCRRAQQYAIRSEETYLRWIKRYLLFHHQRHPRRTGTPEIEAFLTHLALDFHRRQIAVRARKGPIDHVTIPGASRAQEHQDHYDLHPCPQPRRPRQDPQPRPLTNPHPHPRTGGPPCPHLPKERKRSILEHSEGSENLRRNREER